MLRRLSVTGVAGLAPLEIELGPLTALIGPRGSGKSQLLASIAWVTGAGPAPGNGDGSVRAVLDAGGGTTRTVAAPRSGSGDSGAAEGPPTSLLSAKTRLTGSGQPNGGVVAACVTAELQNRLTSDAAAAEALLAAVESCCEDELGGELVLIEEPELMLAPQAQRHLARLLRRLTTTGNQVVYSTWSPAFVDAVHAEEIVRLDLQPAGSVVRRSPPRPFTDEQRLRLAAEFDHERNEMFFARCVILAEGQTERFALPLVFRLLGHDPDAEGIAVVEVGGKGNLPLVANVLRDLHIPCVVVYDTDGGSDPRLDALIDEAAGPHRVVRMDPDFESVTEIRPSDEKVLAAWRRFSGDRGRDIPEPLRQLVDVAVELVG